MPVIRRGDRGVDIVWVQSTLNLLGDGRGLETRTQIYGSQTEAAVKRFQSRKRLKVDGIVGVQTMNALIQEVIDASLSVDPVAITAFQNRDRHVSVSTVPALIQDSRAVVQQDTFMSKIVNMLNTEVMFGLRVGHVLGMSAAILMLYGYSRKK